MTETPQADRKRQERERKRKQGHVPVQEWVHQDDAHRLKRYANRLREERKRIDAINEKQAGAERAQQQRMDKNANQTSNETPQKTCDETEKQNT